MGTHTKVAPSRTPGHTRFLRQVVLLVVMTATVACGAAPSSEEAVSVDLDTLMRDYATYTGRRVRLPARLVGDTHGVELRRFGTTIASREPIPILLLGKLPDDAMTERFRQRYRINYVADVVLEGAFTGYAEPVEFVQFNRPFRFVLEWDRLLHVE